MVSIYVYVQNLDYGVVSNLDYPPKKLPYRSSMNVIQNLDYPLISEATYLHLTAQNV